MSLIDDAKGACSTGVRPSIRTPVTRRPCSHSTYQPPGGKAGSGRDRVSLTQNIGASTLFYVDRFSWNVYELYKPTRNTQAHTSIHTGIDEKTRDRQTQTPASTSCCLNVSSTNQTLKYSVAVLPCFTPAWLESCDVFRQRQCSVAKKYIKI